MAGETRASRPLVLVTGGRHGIGGATARRFAAGGYDVAVWDLAPEAGELADEIARAGAELHYRQVDVCDRAAVDDAAAELDAVPGRLAAVVANAGIVRDAQLIKWRGGEAVSRLAEEDFDSVLAVNLRGVFLTVRAAAPLLIKAGGGSILLASSVVAANGNFGQTSYAAAKAGVVAMAKTWARELGRHGIRVNVVAPGFIDTTMSRAVPEAWLKHAVEHTPLKRLGRPEEVAEAYFWLASPAASFITAAVLNVDGGLVVGS